MLDLLEAWRLAGSSRLDSDLDGKIDDPGAAIMDKAWPKIADAVMGPVLGPQLSELASLMGRDDAPTTRARRTARGWYGYVDKDLRTIAGRPVAGQVQDQVLRERRPRRLPRLALGGDRGGGQRAGEPRRAPDPTAWRSDATAERIRFAPAFLPVHDALDEPADLPAGDQLRQPQVGSRRRRPAIASASPAVSLLLYPGSPANWASVMRAIAVPTAIPPSSQIAELTMK